MTLLLKLVLAPLLVVGSTLAGRRWGDRVAGTLVAFPVVAGPILLIATLEHGTRFGARAASASLLGLVSLTVFAVSFAYAGRRFGWLPSLLIGWSATLVADVVLLPFSIGPYWGLAVVVAVVSAANRLVARIDTATAPVAATPPPWWDLPGRALATGLLVLTVTGISAAVGPAVTGMLAPFPIASGVVAAFVLAGPGPAAAIRTMAGVVRGLTGFAVFSFLLAVLLEPAGVAGAFAAAVAGTLAVHLLWRVPAGILRRAAGRPVWSLRRRTSSRSTPGRGWSAAGSARMSRTTRTNRS